MRRSISLSLPGIIFLIFLQSQRIYTQQTSTLLRLEAKHQLRPGVDLWPRLSSPRTEAERKINAQLTQLNSKLNSDLRQCDAHWLRWAQLVEKNPAEIRKEIQKDWERYSVSRIAIDRSLTLKWLFPQEKATFVALEKSTHIREML